MATIRRETPELAGQDELGRRGHRGQEHEQDELALGARAANAPVPAGNMPSPIGRTRTDTPGRLALDRRAVASAASNGSGSPVDGQPGGPRPAADCAATAAATAFAQRGEPRSPAGRRATIVGRRRRPAAWRRSRAGRAPRSRACPAPTRASKLRLGRSHGSFSSSASGLPRSPRRARPRAGRCRPPRSPGAARRARRRPSRAPRSGSTGSRKTKKRPIRSRRAGGPG